MPKTGSNGQIQRRNGGGQDMARFLLEDLGPQIRLALPKHLDPDRMARVALTALRMTPKLAECDRFSFAGAILSAAQLGLEVNTPLGHAYLIPRENRKTNTTECTLQLGYQGMIELARRSGQVSSIFAYTVHEGDEFHYELGLDPKLNHIPGCDDPGDRNMTHVYAVAKLRGEHDDRQFVVLPKREVEKRRARGFGGGPWKTDYLAMARKTAIRALFTFLPKSPDMARASALDDAADGMRPAGADVYDPQVIDAIAVTGLEAPDPAADESVADVAAAAIAEDT